MNTNRRAKLPNREACLLTTVILSLGCALICFCISCLSSTAAQEQLSSSQVAMPVVTKAMRDYSHIRYALYFFATIYACIVQVILMQSGFSANLRDWAEQKAKQQSIVFLLYYLLLYVAIFLAMLPLAFFSGFALEHSFHLTHQSPRDWVLDTLKHFALGFCLTIPLTASFFLLVRKFPKKWPFVFAAVCSALIGIETFISPILLEPILNKFSPMPAGSLKNRIEELARQAGAPDAPILVADKSKQTDKFNAYVSGLGNSTHIVIWDTTLNKMPANQVTAIVGHELGHYYLRHTYIDVLLLILLCVLQIPVNMYLARPLAARLPKNWRVRGLDDFAITPVLSLIAILGGFLGDPLINAWSRMQEHDADAFSLRVTGDGKSLAQSFVTLSQQNLSEPDPPPFIEFWLFSHPSLKERIEFALGETSR